MVQIQGISSSTKRIGKYENKLIRRLTAYFTDIEYTAVPHSHLNIAWGSIVSDVDLLLLKDNDLTYVEVKSKRDHISRASQQIRRIKDYIDYAYVGTNKKIKTWNDSHIGLITIKDDSVKIVKHPTKFDNEPGFSSIYSLKKKCLTRFLTSQDSPPNNANKYELARYIWTARKNECTRECLKEIVTCGNTCDSFCPISKFKKV